ncbi:MAG: type II toxin-antitoxin system VapC family toxin [Planctomycetes bacterium]|nr:type II toxin-antitoxin system VapC family toxin [Planctomycetota bacterium]
MTPLLDTHVLVWWLEGSDRLSRDHRRILKGASPERPLLISEISLWEVATLNELGRIALTLPLREWLERAAAPPLVQRCGITPAVAAEVASLPASFHRDPADRIIVATARVLGATLLTCDRRILQAKLVPTVA